MPIKKRQCPICGKLFVVHENANDTNPRTYCKRACILKAVGLPADFNPRRFTKPLHTLTQDHIDEMHAILDEAMLRSAVATKPSFQK